MHTQLLFSGRRALATAILLGTTLSSAPLAAQQLLWSDEFNSGDVPDDIGLEVCQAISIDGRSIIGHSFIKGAWRVTIATCDGDVDGADPLCAVCHSSGAVKGGVK